MNKSAKARELRSQGFTIVAIVRRTGLSRSNVYAALRYSPGPKSSKTGVSAVKPFENSSKPPIGECLKWDTAKGDYCGAPCEGQRCEAHKEANPAFNTVSTRFKEIAA